MPSSFVIFLLRLRSCRSDILRRQPGRLFSRQRGFHQLFRDVSSWLAPLAEPVLSFRGFCGAPGCMRARERVVQGPVCCVMPERLRCGDQSVASAAGRAARDAAAAGRAGAQVRAAMGAAQGVGAAEAAAQRAAAAAAHACAGPAARGTAWCAAAADAATAARARHDGAASGVSVVAAGRRPARARGRADGAWRRRAQRGADAATANVPVAALAPTTAAAASEDLAVPRSRTKLFFHVNLIRCVHRQMREAGSTRRQIRTVVPSYARRDGDILVAMQSAFRAACKCIQIDVCNVAPAAALLLPANISYLSGVCACPLWCLRLSAHSGQTSFFEADWRASRQAHGQHIAYDCCTSRLLVPPHRCLLFYRMQAVFSQMSRHTRWIEEQTERSINILHTVHSLRDTIF
eukprot:6176753-Pleurochrysis_carterae.AAC.1